MEHRFICQCLNDYVEGLQEGISHFSGPSRVAAIFQIGPDTPICILDPQYLLRGHEPKLKELYLENHRWLYTVKIPAYQSPMNHMLPEKNLKLAGLISFGGRSHSVFYQMWFSEHHPDMCSTGPTECWLEHAAWRFSIDMANAAAMYTGISGKFLREYAVHAVRDYIVDQMNMQLGWDTPLRVFPILDAILGISKTREEGAWPRGRLMFVDRSSLDRLRYYVRFQEQETPLLENFKHVRKLLISVEKAPRLLVSDGKRIIGIARDSITGFSLEADFRGQYGFLNINGETVCSFSDSSFYSTTQRARIVQLEEALLESELDAETSSLLFQITAGLVHHAQTSRFGCTLVIDLNSQPVPISGQKLEKPLDLRKTHLLQLAEGLLKVDGALHIGRQVELLGFACLLDGQAIAGEDRARGARFNSALRFSARHPNLFVVVVSADHPVSVIQEGIEINAQCQWRATSVCDFAPQELCQWIKEADQFTSSIG